MTRLLPMLCAAALLALPAAARAAREDSQIWVQAGASVALGGNWTLSEEVIARFGDGDGGLYEVENNLLLGYALGEKVTLWAGYTHDPQYDAGAFTAMEHRAREQLTIDDAATILGGSLGLRLRTEQRWREGAGGTGWRVRPYAKWKLPLGGKTSLSFSHESFVNLNRTAFQGQSGYERMRNAVSLTFPLGGKLSADVGYLNQYRFVREGTDTMDHAATVAISLSL